LRGTALTLDYEVSVVLARDEQGRVACFPTGENQHTKGILDVSIVPARTTGCVRAMPRIRPASPKSWATSAPWASSSSSAAAVDRQRNGAAPHNSGHYTIDACVTSQFEQVRALCGLPLGEPRALGLGHGQSARRPVVRRRHTASPTGPALRRPNLKLHLYGKHHARPGARWATSR
jgi:5-(carboxyamino)imidazole ribonucleotide synthase